MIEKYFFLGKNTMEFIKHIVLFFISPLNLVILLYASGVLVSLKKTYAGNILKYFSVLAFFLFTQPYFSDLLLYPLEHKHRYPELNLDKNAYFGESDRSFRFYPITFSSSFSSLPVLP